jgi:Arc/MetJ family transcription regulator
MARTNIVLDDALIERAMKITGARTKRAAVNIALRDLVSRSDLYRALRALRGKLRWEGDLAGWRKSRS